MPKHKYASITADGEHLFDVSGLNSEVDVTDKLWIPDNTAGTMFVIFSPENKTLPKLQVLQLAYKTQA